MSVFTFDYNINLNFFIEYVDKKCIKWDHIIASLVHIRKEYVQCVVKKYKVQRTTSNRQLEFVFFYQVVSKYKIIYNIETALEPNFSTKLNGVFLAFIYLYYW